MDTREVQAGDSAHPPDYALRMTSQLAQLPTLAGLMMIAVGALVVLGWMADVTHLKSVVPGLATMKLNTAGCFVLCGLALALSRAPSGPRHRAAVWLCAGVALAIATVTLAEYALGWDPGIDEWLVADPDTRDAASPGRMSLMTAVAFVWLAGALLALQRRDGWVSLSQTLSTLVLVCGLIGVQGYLYETEALYRFFIFSSMALHTATLFVVAGAGALWLRPHQGFVSVLTAPRAGARYIRPLLLPLPPLVVAIGWFVLHGEERGIYDAPVGIAIFGTVNLVVVAAVSWRLAAQLNTLHGELEARHTDLRHSHRDLHDLRTALNEHAIVAVTDGRGRITSVNEKFCAISGYRVEELIGQDHRIINSGYQSKAFIAGLWSTIQRGEVWHGELRNRAKNGQYYWVATTIVPFLDATGTPVQYVAIRTDITRRKELEDALRAGEEALRQANRDLEIRVAERTAALAAATAKAQLTATQLEQTTERMQLATAAARIGIWDWDIANDVLTWDPTMYRLYGINEADFKGAYDAWRTMVHPDDRAQAEAVLAEALAGQRRFDTSFRIVVMNSQEVRYLRGAAVVHRDAAGRPLRMVGINWDITEQREAEMALRSSERLLREFVTHAPAAIAMLDREMRYLQTSERWLQDYGLSGDVIGRKHYDVFPDIPERWKEIHRRAMAGAIERCTEDAFQRADGSIEWLQWEVRPWLTADGSIGGVIFFTQVITARKRMELDLQNQRRALERSNADLEQFAYVASHDLQEPLRAVAGCTEILRRRYAGQLDASADELIRHIVEGADRMHQLIQDLLAFSRVDRDRLSRSVTDSGEALRRALANLKAAIGETGAHVTHDDMPMLRADPAQLTQLFQNLVGNALKYHGAEPPRVHVAVTKTDDAWEFSVSDNGIGIDARYFDRIFHLFQRLHTRTEYPGTGIGLAICKKIVERHSGRIWVESTPGHGSRFHFTLPWDTQAEP